MRPPISSHPATQALRAALAIVGTLLLADTLALMSQGLLSLGIFLPGLIGATFLVLSWRWEAARRWRMAHRRHHRLWWAGWTLFAAWLATLLLFFQFLSATIRASNPTATTAAAIVILGSGTPHCAVSPTLAARLDEGLALARRWPAAPVVASGGKDFRLGCAEADVMAGYLAAHGLPASRLIREDRSTSTDENLRFSRALLEARGVDPHAPLVIVTSDFHLMRARLIARRIWPGEVYGASASTPLYLRYNAWLREYFAAAVGWMLGEF